MGTVDKNQGEYAQLRSRLNQFQARTVGFADRKIQYFDVGAGEPVVLLHGIGSTGASWLSLFENRLPDTRYIAWDAPGYTVSTRVTSKAPTPHDYAKILDQFLSSIKVEKATIVGHSLGALMGLAFSCAFPERVRRLMLADPARGYGSEQEPTRADKLAARLATLEEFGPEEMANRRAPFLLSANANQTAHALVRWNMAQIIPGGYNQAAIMLANADILEDAQRYNGKTFVICGSEDKITPPDIAKEVSRHLKQGSYHEIAGAGHASYVEQTEVFMALLEQLRNS